MVEIEVANRSSVELDTAQAAELIRNVLREEGIDDGELGFQLVGPDEIRRLKLRHLGIDEETDALAFPIDGREPLPESVPRQLGDVVLCPQVVGDGWRAPLVHAVLHLVGYDHGSEMESRERVFL
jgi:probable rRNA maturation factor